MRGYIIPIYVVVCLLASRSVSAQASAGETQPVWGYVGLKGGGHFSEVLFDDTFRPVNMRTSFVYGKHFGLAGKLFLARHAGIQSEVIFIEKGYKQLLDSGFYSTKMNYVEVPLLMNAYLGNRKNEFFVNLGPYLEFFLNQSEELLGEVGDAEEFYPFDAGSDRTMGYGLRASGGINRLFGFGLLQLEGGVTISISDMLVSDRLTSNVPDGSKHLVGFVSLAYMIPLGKKPDAGQGAKRSAGSSSVQ